MLQIEWKSSHYHSDGRRRTRPKASTVHGWLVKWRATFSGNERLRKEGIREMHEAKAIREWKKRQAARRAKAGPSEPFFRLWRISFRNEKRQVKALKGSSCGVQRPSTKRPSRGGHRRLPSSTRSPRPTHASSRRSSHNRRGGGNRNQHDVRKVSRGIRGPTRTEAVAKKR